MSEERVEVEGEVQAVTDAAILVRVATGGRGKHEDVWLPKSQMSDDVEDVDVEDFLSTTIPEWLAVEKGLV